MRKTDLTPEQTLKKIAEIATDVAWQAGVGSMELAGQFVSVLVANPDKIEAFLSGDMDMIEDDDLFHAERGCLSWHAKNGTIMTPAEMRARQKQPDS